MDPFRLKRLFDTFGHRMLKDEKWRGDLLMQRGLLTVEELRDAVRNGCLVPYYEGGERVYNFFQEGTHFSTFIATNCFYRLTAKGWWTGVAIGASFESQAEKQRAAIWDDGCMG